MASAPLAIAARAASSEPAGERSSGMGREGILMRKLVPCCPNAHAVSGGREIPQDISDCAVSESFEGAVAQLSHALACNAEHFPDLVEGVLTILLESEVQAEDFCIARREREQRALHFIRSELIEYLTFRTRPFLDGESLDERAIGVFPDCCIEANVRRVERCECADDLCRDSGDVRDLARSRLARELLAKHGDRLDDAREIGGAIQGDAHRSTLARERGENGLANPPDGVRAELDALIGIELSSGGHQPDVPFADEIDEWHAAVLILLRDGYDEAKVSSNELLHRVVLSDPDAAGKCFLAVRGEQRKSAYFGEILVENVAIALRRSNIRRNRTPSAFGVCHTAHL